MLQMNKVNIYHFYDMRSGGTTKTPYEHIFIEAEDLHAAISAFQHRFDRDPDHVTCACCGEDYSVTEYETLEEATRDWRGPLTQEAFLGLPGVFKC